MMTKLRLVFIYDMLMGQSGLLSYVSIRAVSVSDWVCRHNLARLLVRLDHHKRASRTAECFDYS